MYKNYTIISLAFSAIVLFAFEHTANGEFDVYIKTVHLTSSGGQSGKTGAPGEFNCTQCHAGTVQDGTVMNTVTVTEGLTPVTSYVPGTTYNVSLQMNVLQTNTKKGFSATILDLSDLKAGTLLGNGGVGVTQDFGEALGDPDRDYVSHTINSNTETQSIWLWTWTAPATDVGDVIIYVASNSANDNGANSGDEIYTSQHIIASTAGINEEIATEFSFEAGYNGLNHQLTINFNSLVSGDMFLNLVDLNGQSVFTYQMGNASVGENNEVVSLPSDLVNGMYVVHYFVGNKSMSANIIIQK